MNRPRLDMHRTIFYSTHLQAYTEHTAIHLSTIIFIQRTVRSEKCTQWKIFFILPPSFPPTFSPLSLAPYYFLNHPPHLLPHFLPLTSSPSSAPYLLHVILQRTHHVTQVLCDVVRLHLEVIHDPGVNRGHVFWALGHDAGRPATTRDTTASGSINCTLSF